MEELHARKCDIHAGDLVEEAVHLCAQAQSILKVIIGIELLRNR